MAVRDERGYELSYGELLRRAQALAAAIGAGVSQPGARCAIELEPGAEAVVALHGVLLAGGVVQLVRPGLPEAEREAALGDWPEVVIDAEWLERVAPGAPRTRPTPERAPDEPVSRVLTSGSSGRPRPIVHTAANHLHSASASALNLGRRPEDRWLCCLPLDHVAGLAILLRSAIYGTGAIVHRGFDPELIERELEAGGTTLISLVPTQLGRLLEARVPLRRCRAVLVGGAAAPPDLVERARGEGVRVVPSYGSTETCSQIVAGDLDGTEPPGSSGRALAGTDVELGPEGEILVRGPTVARGSIAADGYLHTADRGRLDERGYLFVEGRLDDLIVTGGESVAPDEIEAVLTAHPAIAEAAVVGMADPEWGQAVTAYVVPAGSAPSEAELREHCRARLAPFKVPKRFHALERLPRTRTGKPLRAALARGPEEAR